MLTSSTFCAGAVLSAEGLSVNSNVRVCDLYSKKALGSISVHSPI